MMNIGRIIFKRLKFISNKLKNKNSIKALDLGCGEGYWTLNLVKLGFFVDAIDKNEKKIKILEQNLYKFNYKNLIKIYCQDIKKFKFKKNNYDLILCFNLLHLLDRMFVFDLIHKMYKALKPSGRLFIIFKQDKQNFIPFHYFYKFDIIFVQNFLQNNEGYTFLELIKPPFKIRLKRLIYKIKYRVLKLISN